MYGRPEAQPSSPPVGVIERISDLDRLLTPNKSEQNSVETPEKNKQVAVPKDNDTNKTISQSIEKVIYTHAQFNVIGKEILGTIGPLVGETCNLSSSDTDNQHMMEEIQTITAGVGLALGFIVYIWYYCKTKLSRLRKKKNSDANFDETQENQEIKTLLISWTDRYESGNLIGTNIGQLLAAFIPTAIPGISDLLKTGMGNLFGFFTGLCFAVFLPDTEITTDASIFRLGKDGWTSYTKLGALIGGMIGMLIFAIICSLSLFPGGTILGIALGSTIGSITGFATTAVLVPTINYFSSDSNNEKTNISSYRNSYISAGATLGACIGGIIGFALAFAPPFCFLPFSTFLLSSMFAATFGLIGAVIGGALGPGISATVEEKKTNRLDSGLRAGSSGGNEVGKLTSNLVNVIEPNNQFDVKNITTNGGALIGSLTALGYDIYQNKINQTTDTPNTIFPWTKRFWIFGSMGSMIGSLCGIPGGLIGIAIGASVGYCLFGLVGIVFGEEIITKLVPVLTKTSNKLTQYLTVLLDEPTITKTVTLELKNVTADNNQVNFMNDYIRQTTSKSDSAKLSSQFNENSNAKKNKAPSPDIPLAEKAPYAPKPSRAYSPTLFNPPRKKLRKKSPLFPNLKLPNLKII